MIRPSASIQLNQPSISPLSRSSYLNHQTDSARTAISRYLEGKDGSLLVVQSPESSASTAFTNTNWILYGCNAVYAYTIITGTLPLTLTIAYPVLAYYSM